MSGICAVLGSDAEKVAKTVSEGLKHRGIGESFFVDTNLALGHRMPQTAGIQVEKQPLSNEDKTVWITFDGEIFNAGTLKESLEKRHSFKTNSSAEVVVHAYEEFSVNCLHKFNGMFAFCLWDSKKKTLFAARDRLGIKPLYYCDYENWLILASEIKGILAYPLIPRKPNTHFIYQYIITGYPNRANDTFFVGIKELMPSHFMLIRKSGFHIQKYWHPIQQSKSTVIREDDFYASEFLRLFQDSIRIRLPAESPVGTFLSGGLDSTSIVFVVDKILKLRNNTNTREGKLQEIFSAIHESPEQGDERSYIKEVERTLKTEINYVFPSVVDQWDNIKRFVFHIEEPVAVFNYYVFWCLFQAARQKVKTVFSGQGTDAILGGQPQHSIIYYKELWKRKNLVKLSKELVKESRWILPWLVGYVLFSRKAESNAKALLAPQFVTAHSSDASFKEPVSLDNALLRDVTQHSIEYLRVDDRASSAFSMERMYPFLDHRIVEFAFSLPAEQKIRDGWTKYVLRKAVKGLIPETIRSNRAKFGTPIPQQRWIKELRQNIEELLKHNAFKERGYFNQYAILEIFNLYCDGKLNRLGRHYYANVLWRIINLELWLETFFD
jgi:asparagine synthase (glutamine-hydrolysing)